MNEGLAVHEVATEAGVAPSTVRLYARLGILRTRRTTGNARRFGYDAPCRIAIAKVAQRTGLGLTKITELLHQLPDEATQADWNRLNAALIAAAEERITALREVVEDITTRAPPQDLPLSPEEVRERRIPQSK